MVGKAELRRPDKAQPPSGTGSGADACTGGIDSLCSPFGQPTHCVRGLSNGFHPLSNPGRGFSSPLARRYMRKKSPHFHASSSSNNGGEGGIRTPDTLPYTHFPGVLLQPLGHLTTLYCHPPYRRATGRYYRELR